MKQSHLAAVLGVSPAMVSKMKAAGMPCTSAAEAKAWRQANLSLGHTKALRIDYLCREPDPAAVLRRLKTFGEAAAIELEAGRFGELADDLRETMRSLPAEHRPHLAMPAAVWDALIPAAVVEELRAPPDDGERPATPEDAEEVGQVVYGLACGELVIRPRRRRAGVRVGGV